MALAAWLLLLTAAAALAQTQLGFPPGNPGGGASDRIIQIFVLISALSLLPALFITMTSFTRFIVALSFLRSGLGLQNTPANMVMIVLSVFMTAFVMSPTFERAWRDGVSPLMENRISEPEAFEKVTSAFRDFMLAQVRDKDLKLFADLAKENLPKKDRAETDLRILAPAFMISELRRGFEMGFLIAIPFLIIDMVVAIVVMSMGMMMMPPSVIALPLKVLFFILIDGWNLLVGSLVRSYT
jgi:flagellar biosynthesis protein FliP